MAKSAASSQDPYLDPVSGILRNRLGITDAKQLEWAEAACSTLASYELDRNPPPGRFDLSHLQVIHKRLFDEVYTWAGELRQVDIIKGSTRFAHAAKIERASAKLFEQLAGEKYLAGLNADAFSDRAGFYLGEINALHPFREGNGRAQREFIGQLAHEAGYHIDWSSMPRDAMVHAFICSYHSDHTALAALIRAHLVERTTAKSFEVASPPFEIAAHHRNLIVRDADVLKRDVKGEVVATTSQHVWLQVADRLAVRYEKGQLDREVQLGEKLAIRYGEQKSQVYEQDKMLVRERGQGFERDRER